MSTNKTAAQTILPWLKSNGMNLGALTGQDRPALCAAAEIMSCFARCDGDAEPHLLRAFNGVAMAMQPSTRYLAYHAIAHLMEWHSRADIWQRASLEPLSYVGRCKYE